MITKTVNQYICEFCGKKKYSASAMRKHEKHCTMNPKKECFLIFEDHEPVKLVDSMKKFNKHDSHGKTKTWLSFDLE